MPVDARFGIAGKIRSVTSMERIFQRFLLAGLLAAFAGTGCATIPQGSTLPGQPDTRDREALARAILEGADAIKLPHTEADVQFMTGMIHHHAQALVMARWSETHGARQDIRMLSRRILVSQQDEIDLMQSWLRDRGLPVTDANPRGMMMEMDGHHHEMLMPGMLTEAQFEELDRARGRDFDRLFLTFMIQHHQGAVSMVDTLFASPGAGQDELIYRFASDVYADQTTEIDRMQKMLADITGRDRGPR